MATSPKKQSLSSTSSSSYPLKNTSPTPSPESSPTPLRKPSSSYSYSSHSSIDLTDDTPSSKKTVQHSHSVLVNNPQTKVRSRHTNLLRCIDKSIDESLTVINETQLASLFDSTLREEFDGLNDLVIDLQNELRESLKSNTQRVLEQYQLEVKLNRLDTKIKEAKNKNSTFPSTLDEMIPNPILTDLAVHYESYSNALEKIQKQVNQAEENLRNEKIQYQVKLKEWQNLSNQRKEKVARIHELISPVLSLNLSMIEEDLAL